MEGFTAVVALALGGAVGPSEEEQPATGYSLAWNAPAACPDAVEIEGAIDRWLASAPPPSSDPATVSATVTEVGGRFAMDLTIETADGASNHRAESQSCSALADALAVQVALALDPSGAGRMTSVKPEPAHDANATQPPPPPREPEPPPPTPPVSKPSPRPKAQALQAGVWLEGGLGLRRVPRIDGRIAGGGALLLRAARVELGYAHTFAQTAAHPSIAGVTLRIRQWSAVARGCWRPTWRQLEFGGCGGLEAGALSVIGSGVARPKRDRGAWVALLARVSMAWRPSPWFAVGPALEGHAAVLRPATTVADLPVFFTPGVLGVTGSLRVEARFP